MMLSDTAKENFIVITAVILLNNLFVLNQRVACLIPNKKFVNEYFLSYYLNFRRRVFG